MVEEGKTSVRLRFGKPLPACGREIPCRMCHPTLSSREEAPNFWIWVFQLWEMDLEMDLEMDFDGVDGLVVFSVGYADLLQAIFEL